MWAKIDYLACDTHHNRVARSLATFNYNPNILPGLPDFIRTAVFRCIESEEELLANAPPAGLSPKTLAHHRAL